ncbi:protein TolR [Ketobacter sp.]|uniref:protein TolR n=1 Tax=Ketobacter sp. TaxID=2083498 RepID=UPI000F117A4D|nr:protein TolR [Ketobacter sp.]RLT99238.1 MAG: protein TolR [Ketobacter sp.]
MGVYRAGRKPKAEMNVVPYIDVMLVLLVIFMVTAPMLTPQHVPVELPKVASAALPSLAPQQIVTLTVQEDGGYHWHVGSELNEQDVTDSAMSLPQMSQRIQMLVASDPQTRVFIRADTHADYGHVVAAMSALQNNGITRLGLLTETP